MCVCVTRSLMLLSENNEKKKDEAEMYEAIIPIFSFNHYIRIVSKF